MCGTVAALGGPPIPNEYRDFIDVFSKEKGESLPEHTPFDHTIDLEPGKVPPYKPIYGLTLKEQEALPDYIRDGLEKGRIRESKGPAGAPILFVPKKDALYVYA
jgi:hypothetical protein